MDEKELQDLQEPGNWDYENAAMKPGVRKPRVVVSVSFARDDFESVNKHAERLNMRTSEFTRKAALDAVHYQPRPSVIFSSGSLGALIVTSRAAPATRVYGTETLKYQEPKLEWTA